MWRVIKPWIIAAYKQVFAKETARKGKLRLTRNAVNRMHEYNVTEKDIDEVFRYGKEVKEGMIVRKYTNEQIGITYKWDINEYVIITCWKR